ncbi:MAG: CbiX/SirB N-terminal domain-containing protein [Candidatus Sumerlaeaceae bacterium]|nr:CbiX/SirB N-terminal domain-containing protein [Candidatus Sumerlaeaceae bacterium]
MNAGAKHPAVILFSHGSTLCGSSDTIYAHAAALRSLGPWCCVEVGFLNYSQPRFAETVATVVKQGAVQIVVVPYFLVAGKFVREDLQREMESVRSQYPHVEFWVAEPIGYHPALADVVLELCSAALPPHRWRDELVRVAARCEARPECPLYGHPPCKAQPSAPAGETCV